MNKLPPNAIIITDIVGDTVKIMVCHVNNEQKNIIISQLINEGALFLHGNGWYPSEVMECNKDQKNYFGKYKIIYWIDKNTYQIEER
ncbi:hypothetical protein D3C71_1621860 [compost metagenome]